MLPASEILVSIPSFGLPAAALALAVADSRARQAHRRTLAAIEARRGVLRARHEAALLRLAEVREEIRRAG